MRLVLVVMALSLSAWSALADPPPNGADAAFQRGRELAARGDYDGACAAFVESLELDFQYGTLYNIGACEESRGRLVAAWRVYQRLAAEDPNEPRRLHAAELAARLVARLPKLVINLPTRPAGVVVTIDGETIGGVDAARPVEAGSHVVVVAAPGYRKWQTTATATAGAVTKLTPLLEAEPTTAESASSDRPVATATRSAPDRRYVRRHPLLGGSLAIGGAVSLVAGISIVLYAKDEFDTNHAAAMQGNAMALSRTNDAYSLGNVATVFSIAGLLVAPVGAILWHQGEWHVTAAVESHAVAFAWSGRF